MSEKEKELNSFLAEFEQEMRLGNFNRCEVLKPMIDALNYM